MYTLFVNSSQILSSNVGLYPAGMDWPQSTSRLAAARDLNVILHVQQIKNDGTSLKHS